MSHGHIRADGGGARGWAQSGRDRTDTLYAWSVACTRCTTRTRIRFIRVLQARTNARDFHRTTFRVALWLRIVLCLLTAVPVCQPRGNAYAHVPIEVRARLVCCPGPGRGRNINRNYGYRAQNRLNLASLWRALQIDRTPRTAIRQSATSSEWLWNWNRILWRVSATVTCK